jgi:hypothetical protein
VCPQNAHTDRHLHHRDRTRALGTRILLGRHDSRARQSLGRSQGSLHDEATRKLSGIVRLHIIGIPSAGKTTLAKDVSSRLDLPYHGLDPVAFVDDRWTLGSVPERDAMVAGILDEPSFVTEGGFLGWTEDLFSAADHIVWLDPPLTVLIWRHMRRFGRRPWWLPSLLRFQLRMYLRPAGTGPAKDDPNQTRAGIEAALRPWAYKVLRVTRPTTADELIEKLALAA